MLKVKSIEIIDYKLLEHEEIKANGRSVIVMGKNETGKTSVIQALYSGVTGKDFPDKPIREGAKSAKIIIELEGDKREYYKITRKFTPSGSTLVLEDDKEEKKSPQKHINKLVGNISFDPFEFAKKTKVLQANYLLECMDLDATEFIQSIVDKKEDVAFAKKTAENIKGSMIESEYYKNNIHKFESGSELLKSIGEMGDEEGTNLSVLVDKLNTTKDNNRIIAAAKASVKSLFEKLDDSAEVVKKSGVEKERIKKQYDLDILALNKRYDDDMEIQENKEAEETRFQKECNVSISDLKESASKEETPTNEMEAELKLAETASSEFESKKKMKADYVSFTAGKVRFLSLKEDLNKLRAEYLKLLRDADLPEDFVMDENGLMYKGLPYSSNQINTASIIKSGIELIKSVGIKNGLYVVRFDSSFLDKDSRNEVLDLLDKNKLQAFIEMVSESEELQISYYENNK